MTLSLAAQTNPTTLKAAIDLAITNKVGPGSISKQNVGNNMKATVDYTTEQSALAEKLTNKSINVTTDGASDTKYPSVKAVKDYVDANAGGASIRKMVKVSLSASELSALFTTPKVLIPGVAGKLNVVSFIYQKYTHVSSAYTTLGLARLAYGTTSTWTNAFALAIQSAAPNHGFNSTGFNSTFGTDYSGLDIILFQTTANPNGGDGSLDIYIVYDEITI